MSGGLDMVQLAIGRRGGCLFGSPEILPLYSGSGDFRGVKPPDFPVLEIFGVFGKIPNRYE